MGRNNYTDNEYFGNRMEEGPQYTLTTSDEESILESDEQTSLLEEDAIRSFRDMETNDNTVRGTIDSQFIFNSSLYRKLKDEEEAPPGVIPNR